MNKKKTLSKINSKAEDHFFVPYHAFVLFCYVKLRLSNVGVMQIGHYERENRKAKKAGTCNSFNNLVRINM